MPANTDNQARQNGQRRQRSQEMPRLRVLGNGTWHIYEAQTNPAVAQIAGPGAANAPQPCAQCGKADRDVRLSYGVHWLHEACEAAYIKAQTAGFGPAPASPPASPPPPQANPADSPSPSSAAGAAPVAEIVIFQKHDSVLSKRLHLNPDETLGNDSGECRMATGAATRRVLSSIDEFAAFIDACPSDMALALGHLKRELAPDEAVHARRRQMPTQ
jgi:hypothetical protein